ncbi:MAG TPA: SPOR domain-containing protein [Rhodocyclaceae bacterium]|nr:SPOR domain-containing protein [Rhodocyclaceae bacterium]HNH35109.1 SPOR domain-containing protein [Rhodocyclaceae bacterium]
MAKIQGKARPAPGRKSRGGTLLGLFLGLVVGVLISFGVVWYLNKTPLPFQNKTGRPEAGKTADAKAPEGKPGQLPAPQALPGKPGDKAGTPGEGDRPRFEFYKILPGGQDAATAAPPPPAAEKAPAAPEVLYLQAGAFQKAADADNLKAKLALNGVEAGVQEINLPEKGVMYRVRVGPFAKAEEMNRVRNQLAQGGIQTTVVKNKD